MKQAFEAYLNSVGIVGALMQRVDVILTFYERISPEEITDIVVSEYVKEDGSREYENLWFFSTESAMEAKAFIQQDNFDMVSIRKRLAYWRIEKRDYDFQQATDKSRMTVHFSTGPLDITGDLRASKENCDHLRDIFMNRILANMV
jgi:hypothetical protein